jgi:hypothetical protein
MFAAWDVSDDASCSLHRIPSFAIAEQIPFFSAVITILEWEFGGCAKDT